MRINNYIIGITILAAACEPIERVDELESKSRLNDNSYILQDCITKAQSLDGKMDLAFTSGMFSTSPDTTKFQSSREEINKDFDQIISTIQDIDQPEDFKQNVLSYVTYLKRNTYWYYDQLIAAQGDAHKSDSVVDRYMDSLIILEKNLTPPQ